MYLICLIFIKIRYLVFINVFIYDKIMFWIINFIVLEWIFIIIILYLCKNNEYFDLFIILLNVDLLFDIYVVYRRGV